MYKTGVTVYGEDQVAEALREPPGLRTLSRDLTSGAQVTLWRTSVDGDERFHARIAMGPGGPFKDFRHSDITAVLQWVNEQDEVPE